MNPSITTMNANDFFSQLNNMLASSNREIKDAKIVDFNPLSKYFCRRLTATNFSNINNAINSGVDMSEQDYDGNNLLHYLMAHTTDCNDEQSVKQFDSLLDKALNSIDPNVKNLEGNTPLHLLCVHMDNFMNKQYNYSLFEKFFKAGADANAINANGENPLTSLHNMYKKSVDTKLANLNIQYGAVVEEKYLIDSTKFNKEDTSKEIYKRIKTTCYLSDEKVIPSGNATNFKKI